MPVVSSEQFAEIAGDLIEHEERLVPAKLCAQADKTPAESDAWRRGVEFALDRKDGAGRTRLGPVLAAC